MSLTVSVAEPRLFANSLVRRLVKSGWKMTSPVEQQSIVEVCEIRRQADTDFMAGHSDFRIDAAIEAGTRMAQTAYIEGLKHKRQAHEAALSLAALRDTPCSDLM